MEEEYGDASDMTNVAQSESNSEISKLDSEGLISFKNDKQLFDKFIDQSFSGEFNKPFSDSLSNIVLGKNSTIVNKTYIESVDIDENGKPIKKIYTSQSVNTTKDGNNLSEINARYMDEEKGLKKSLEQKLLNNKGFKTIKTRDYVNKEDREDKYLKGIGEDQVETFFKNCLAYKNRCNHNGNKYLK